AGIVEPGWIAALSADEEYLFEAALAGLYQRAGTDLVREQIAAKLPPGAPYDIDGDRLIVWKGDWQGETIYSLDPESATGQEFLFPQHPITWDAWVAYWSGPPSRLLAGPPILVPALTPPSPASTLLSR